jgi:hypothetical protein
MSASNDYAFESDWQVGGRKAGVPGWRRDLSRVIADTSYVALRLSGWLAMTTLAAMGVTVLFFLMLGNFTPLGFFSQIANLGSHFVSADAARRATFVSELRIVAAFIFGTVALLRWPLLIGILVPTKGIRHG